MSVQERLQPALQLAPEVASLNMGSMNFGLHPLLGKYTTFKHSWEPAYLEATRDMVFRNTFKDIEYILASCQDNGTRFEFECYDTSHLYNLAHLLDRGLVKGTPFIQTVFGILGGIGTHPDDVSHMRRTADRLFGDQYIWSVLGAGRFQMPIASMAAVMGGNVRVGLEDSLWESPGQLAVSNASQVRRVRQILEGLSLTVASPDEARAMLGLVVGVTVGDTTLGTTIGNLGFEAVRFPAPVFHGDTLRAETEIISVRESKSRPDNGIVVFEHRGYNQNNVLVATIRRSALMRKKP